MGLPEREELDVLQMQREIIDELKLVDAKTLRLVHSMMRAHAVERELEEDPIVDHTIDGTPIREKEFFAEADKAVIEVRNGGGTPADVFFKETEQWLKDLK